MAGVILMGEYLEKLLTRLVDDVDAFPILVIYLELVRLKAVWEICMWWKNQ